MAYELPDLPYDYDALAPHMSADTLRFHHDKHHNTYVDTYNKLVQGTDLDDKDLESVIRTVAGDPDKKKLFNNAAQSWNHSFFWLCMTPETKQLGGNVGEEIDRAFGSLDDFKSSFREAAVGQFGSGWAWLVWTGDGMKIVATPNAENPMTDDMVPLLTCDVWEHAYYLDYQNRRPDFVSAFLDHLVDWDFVGQRLSRAREEGREEAIALRRSA